MKEVVAALQNIMVDLNVNIQTEKSKNSSFLFSFFRNITFSNKHIQIREVLYNDLKKLKPENFGNAEVYKNLIIQKIDSAIEASAELIIKALIEDDPEFINGKAIDCKDQSVDALFDDPDYYENGRYDKKKFREALLSGQVGTDQHFALCEYERTIENAFQKNQKEKSEGNRFITNNQL